MNEICVFKGIIIAKPYILKREDMKIDFASCNRKQIEEQMDIFEKALLKTKVELNTLKAEAETSIGKEESKIINVQLVMLDDPLFIDGIMEKINEGRKAEAAVEMTRLEIEESFKCMSDKIIKLREEDINDVSSSVIKNILGVPYQNLSNVKEPVVLIAEDLTPSDIIHMHKNVKGIILESYNYDSHSAIMIRTLGIPTISKVNGATNKFYNADLIILDTVNNKIITNPTERQVDEYKCKAEQFEIEKQKLLKLKYEESKTIDGRRIYLFANIESAKQIDDITAFGAEGIGLYKTEFIFSDKKSFLSEEEQFEIYKNIAENFNGEIIIRTFDVSGDKDSSEYIFAEDIDQSYKHTNIRFCLYNKNIFKNQLRAILRASAYGELKIMCPKIFSMEAFDKVNNVLEECKKELKAEEILFDDNIKVGITIEISTATVIIGQLAKKVDFINIEINYLFQYLQSTNRENNESLDIYRNIDPLLIRNIKLIVDGAHNENKTVEVCGEIAGNIDYVTLLIGLGIDILSMDTQNIYNVKDIIRSIKYEKAIEIVNSILQGNSDIQSKNTLDILIN